MNSSPPALDADAALLTRAVDLSRQHMRAGHGGPFGAVVARGAEVIAEGWNQVTAALDPTAHAEIVAIRGAAARLADFRLSGCTLYASCEPCPMCLAAACWARVDRVVFAATRQDAAAAGFDDAFLYEELAKPWPERALPAIRLPLPEALAVLEEWRDKADKIAY